MELNAARAALTRRLGVDRTAVDRARRDNKVFQYPQLIGDRVLEMLAKALPIAEILAADRKRRIP